MPDLSQGSAVKPTLPPVPDAQPCSLQCDCYPRSRAVALSRHCFPSSSCEESAAMQSREFVLMGKSLEKEASNHSQYFAAEIPRTKTSLIMGCGLDSLTTSSLFAGFGVGTRSLDTSLWKLRNVVTLMDWARGGRRSVGLVLSHPLQLMVCRTSNHSGNGDGARSSAPSSLCSAERFDSRCFTGRSWRSLEMASGDSQELRFRDR